VTGQVQAGRAAGLIPRDPADGLLAAHATLSAFRMAARLLGPAAPDAETTGSSGEALILRALGKDSRAEAGRELVRLQDSAARIIEDCLAGWAE